MPPKSLFEGDEATEPTGFTINKNYAQKFDSAKRKKELQKLQAKYGDSDSTDDSEPEDDDAVFLTEQREAEFAKLLLALRRGSSEIFDPSHTFFTTDEANAEPPSSAAFREFKLKDEYQRAITTGRLADEVKEPNMKRVRKGPSTAQQKQAKASFLKATEETLPTFDVKKAEEADAPVDEVEMRRRARAKRRLEQALSPAAEDDDDEKFLKNFFLNERWKAFSSEEPPLCLEQIEADNRDEEFFDEAERWEKEFSARQYRHQEGLEALQVKTFPRQAEGTVRQKNSSRKDARERADARKKEEEDRATSELRRLKTLKRLEIKERQEMIARVAGLQQQPTLPAELLQKDFDPKEFDEMMRAMLGEKYEEAEDAEFEAEKREIEENEVNPAEQSSEVLDLLYPTREIEESFMRPGEVKQPKSSAPDLGAMQQDLDKAVDEYWKLHYDKVVGGDTRTRFKYRTVNPEHFGISDIDVLVKDDRTLSMITPMNCYAAYLSAADNKKDRFKSFHRSKNLRMLPPERVSRRYHRSTIVFDPDDPQGPCIARRLGKAARMIEESEKDRESPAGKETAQKKRRTE